jgi:hypothetical protein
MGVIQPSLDFDTSQNTSSRQAMAALLFVVLIFKPRGTNPQDFNAAFDVPAANISFRAWSSSLHL